MTTFSQLKKNSGSKNNLERLTKYAEELGGNKKRQADERFWYPAVDKAGNGSALIRFLPTPDGGQHEFVRLFTHGFQEKRWFIENCPTTIGGKCPVCEHNSELWNTGVEAHKALVRGSGNKAGRKRQLSYIANIYVIKDPANPENEGKVFLFRYGKKIHDMIQFAMKPPADGIEEIDPIDPYDLWEGANFKMVIRNVDGRRNYDKSGFLASTPLMKDDAKLEEIWKSEYDIEEFVSKGSFKDYNTLMTQFNAALGAVAPQTTRQAVEEVEEQWSKTDELNDEQPRRVEANDDVISDADDDFFASLKG